MKYLEKTLDGRVFEYNDPLDRDDGPTRKPCGIPSEMADVVIRVLHFCGKHGIDIEKAVIEKMAFNESRPHMHGKKI
jgi:NTP pyrophosphatase (non-canonical NTP hydrolase)